MESTPRTFTRRRVSVQDSCQGSPLYCTFHAAPSTEETSERRMKQCPSCQRTFEVAQGFCTYDGTPLVSQPADDAPLDLQKTIMAPAPPPPPQQPPIPQPFAPNPPAGGGQYAPPTQPASGQTPGGWTPPPPQNQWGAPPPAQAGPQAKAPYGNQPYGGVQSFNSAGPSYPTGTPAAAGGNGKLMPALIGGLVAGVPMVLPVGILRMGCIVWGVLGGVLAAMQYVKSSRTPVRPADGAIIGALAGVFGAVLFLFLGMPLTYAMSGGSGQVIIGNRPYGVGAFIALGGLFGAVLLIISAVIGGLIGSAIFEKRKPGANTPPPAPPPQNFGGPYGGNYNR